MNQVKTPTIARHFRFDAAHRVLGHESKCRHLHGHGYEVWVSARTKPNKDLDSLGRVVDFGVIKQILGPWINDNWDHGTILNSDDPICDLWAVKHLAMIECLEGHKLYTLTGNPTAELLAAHLLGICQRLFADIVDIEIFKVRIYETPNCFADAELENTTTYYDAEIGNVGERFVSPS